MENWFLVDKSKNWRRSLGVFCLSLGSIIILTGQQNAWAIEPNQTIRFYKINNKEQADKIRFTASKARRPGCHNFIKTVRVHRVVQIGYAACSVYASKNCKTESLVPAIRTKEPHQKKTELGQGYSWFPVDENKRGARLKSWQCE